MNRALRAICAAFAAFFLFVGSASADGIDTSTTSNAPGVLIEGTDVSLLVPHSSDNSLKMGAALKVIESAPGVPAIKTALLNTGYVNSCAASPATGIAMCSGLFGSSYIVRPRRLGPGIYLAPPSYKVGGFKSGVTKLIHFTGGDCANCGVVIDDDMGLAIIATSKGYLPVQLSPLRLQPIISTNGEAISGNFGYDPINHRILSPNYQIVKLKHFKTGTPHYQIINMSDGEAFDLSDNNDFFNAKGNWLTSTGSTQRDALPDSGAYDTTTGIAYGTFRSPSDCVGANNLVEDIALFDLTQASFDPDNGTWSTPGKQVQTSPK